MSKIQTLVDHINDADAIVLGAGSGMSNAAGMDFWYEASPLFMKYMKDFYDKYHFKGLFNGFYNRFDSEEEHWAFLLKDLDMSRTIPPQKPTYEYLQKILATKPFHIITTNQDGLFKRFFKPENISEIQGSFEFFQSKNPHTDKQLYPSKPILDQLLPQIKDNRLPKELIPTSDVDGAPLIPWVRGPEFLEDQRYYEEYEKANRFIGKYRDKKIVFIEIGVGRMTPMFIQEPFWEMANYLPHAFYVNFNPKDALTNPAIEDKSLLINGDTNEALKQTVELFKEEHHD